MGLLRRHLRHTLKEMALASVQQPGIDSANPTAARGDTDKKQRGVQRYFKQQKFVDDATKLYKNLSVPIYIVPAWSGAQPGYDVGSRATAGVHDTVATLMKFGMSEQRANELEQARKSGAAIFIAQASQLMKGGLPSPWMIVHAIFDDLEEDTSSLVKANPKLFASYRSVRKLLDSLDVPDAMDDYPGEEEDFSQFKKFLGALTMGSARTNQIQTSSDAVCEIMTQATLTSNGFVYNETDDDQVNKVLQKIAKVTSGARQAFESAIAGKMIDIDVFLRG